MILPRTQPQPRWFEEVLCAPAMQHTRQPAIIEIGPGNGEFLRHLATQHPDAHVIGMEIQSIRFAQQRQRCRDCPNVTCVLGDAKFGLPQITAHFGPCRELHIHFPDPWPKRKHAGHRLMQPAFIQQCAQSLVPNGSLYFTTDDADYAAAVAKRCAAEAALVNQNTTPMVINMPTIFPSYFAQKWARAGRTIYSQWYRRVG